MSVQAQIDRINNAKAGIAEAISEKGVAVAEGTSIDDLPGLVRSIPQGGGSAVQSDYAQNDSTQPDYIKNRPFYKEGYSYEWDGTAPDESKKVSGSDSRYYYYKISDNIMAASDLVGATVVTNSGITRTISEGDINAYDNGSFAYKFSSYVFIIVCVEAGSLDTSLGVLELTPGLWYLNGGFYARQLEKDAGIKQIDNEFIPKATAIDDDNADLPVTAGLLKTELENVVNAIDTSLSAAIGSGVLE